MARKLTIAALFTCLLLLFLWKGDLFIPEPGPLPIGGETIVNGVENEDNQEKRQQWIDLMHQTPDGVDWKAMVYQTFYKRHQQRMAELRARPRNGVKESFADSTLSGTWKERGSVNQAGSVYDVAYDVEEDAIYVIAAGGSLLKGNREGTDWEVINQDLQFDRHFLEIVSKDEQKRLLAFTGRILHYSDDMGSTWQPAEGIVIADGGGAFFYPTLINDSTLFVLAKPSYLDDLALYKSTDYGEHFYQLLTLYTYDPSMVMMHSPEGSSEVYLVEKVVSGVRLWQLDQLDNELVSLNFNSTLAFGDVGANIFSVLNGDGLTRFYLYTNGNNGGADVYLSEDFGASWEYQGTVPERPWAVGLYASPSDPDRLFTGGVEAYRSFNRGVTWTKVNNWYDYYNDIEHQLHADIMHYGEFQDPNGNPFLLISNHGGLSISYNDLISNTNIGLEGLNVSQYYSVRSSAEDPYFIFAGSQDQGLQRSFTYDQGIAEFEQVISGDYGHLVLTDEGSKLWSVYPGGVVSYYSNAENGTPVATAEINSVDESVWLPPLMADPFGNGKIIYMAGGSISGGSGSYLIRLEADLNGITKTQLPFNFKSASGGELSAIGASPVNPLNWYAATTNGYFFYSNDGGNSWTVSTDLLASGQWLYGQKILPSKKEAQTVIVGGNGYQGPPAWISEDGGATFQPFDNGLPPTLIIDMASNENESFIFAATETGPYLYAQELGQWYDMSGLCAPAQTYWSVEYVSDLNTIRFGTYGRGIWDFEIDQEVNVEELETVTETAFSIQPNPTYSTFRLFIQTPTYPFHGIAQLIDLSGKVIQTKEMHVLNEQFEMPFDVEPLESGMYILSLMSEDGQRLKALKVVKK